MFIADTHSFLWYLADDPRLGKKARAVFERAERGEEIVVIPAIVLAESFYVVKKKEHGLEFNEILDRIEGSINFPPYPLDVEVVKGIQELDRLSELHDRIIVATARILNGTLLSNDKDIRDSKYIAICW